MSHMLRQSLNANSASSTPAIHQSSSTPVRPRPTPLVLSETDEHSSSDSSASSADSSASINTIRPGSREQEAPATHWTSYFAQELHFQTAGNGNDEPAAEYHAYLTPPSDPSKGPLFICHHGAGSTGMSFATFARRIMDLMPAAGILSLDARGHGSTISPLEGSHPLDYSLSVLAEDAARIITLTKERMNWPAIPPTILIGHSLGGAVVTQLAANYTLGNALIGFCVIDVVEGSAIEALAHMQTYLRSRPTRFDTIDEAVQWHLRTRTIRDRDSAAASVPALLVPIATGPRDEGYTWRTNLQDTVPWWDGWFAGMSGKFLRGRGAKLLILAGADRLDKELMIGQMQGKFQLVVLPTAGHFVQEDMPQKTAQLVIDFFRRNDRSAMVLPPKVSDLIAQGKKV